MKRYMPALVLMPLFVFATAIAVTDAAAQKDPAGGRERFRQASSTGLVPLCDMGKDEQYEGQDGGLYGQGQNDPPPAFAAMPRTAKCRLSLRVLFFHVGRGNGR